ncbi:TELO2-interacting protein 1 [Tanacetum coccineum]
MVEPPCSSGLPKPDYECISWKRRLVECRSSTRDTVAEGGSLLKFGLDAVAALLNALCFCSNSSCQCKQLKSLPRLLDNNRYSQSFPVHELDIDECLLAFLRSQSAAVTVGHWLSLLLKAADAEAARGHKGSSKIRVEAFITLRVLVAKVGTADQLAFFLPGVVSQIGKVLHVSKTIISRAAGSMEAMDQALRALTKFLMIVLQDEANISSTKRVRQGIMAAIQGLLATCSHTLKESRLMLQECLCALVCDDDEEVSEAAHMFLESLFSSSGRHHLQRDFADIFNRLFEKLPEVVVGGEQSLAHSQKLLVLIYYSGPQLVKDRLLHSPVTAARFFDTLTLCLSQNSVFSGSLDKLLLERPSSVGYLRSITEMKATTIFENGKTASVESNAYEDPNSYKIQNEYDLPRMPPWFSSSGNQKLYQSLAGILRLVSLSLVAGKLVRQASTAVCILNEMVFGLSDQAVDNMKSMFRNNISG